MSGPIVRKYGFPNFEKIFGDRDLKHGVEDEAPTIPAAPANPPADEPARSARPDQPAEPAPTPPES